MMWLLQAGGPGGSVTILFGLVALVNAALLARRPNPRRQAIVAAMSRATIFAGLASVAAGFVSTFLAAQEQLAAGQHEGTALLVVGMAESLSSPMLGFTFVALVAMLEAVAARRAEG